MVTASPIAWRVLGAAHAPWLVICHGMAIDSGEFAGVADRLAASYRVLLWNMPGHGDSAPLKTPVSAGAMADVLEHTMAAAGVDHAVLLGFSFGGVVAQIFAHRHPTRVDALIAYGCYTAFGHKPLVARSLVGPLVAARFGWRRWPAIRDDFAAACALTPAGRDYVAAAADRCGKPLFLAMLRALLRAAWPDERLALGCPVLLAMGAQDSNAPAIQAGFDTLANANPQARRIIIADAGHCAHLDAPVAFLAAIEDFLGSDAVAASGSASRGKP